jgi:hypothetical protein
MGLLKMLLTHDDGVVVTGVGRRLGDAWNMQENIDRSQADQFVTAASTPFTTEHSPTDLHAVYF